MNNKIEETKNIQTTKLTMLTSHMNIEILKILFRSSAACALCTVVVTSEWLGVFWYHTYDCDDWWLWRNRHSNYTATNERNRIKCLYFHDVRWNIWLKYNESRFDWMPSMLSWLKKKIVIFFFETSLKFLKPFVTLHLFKTKKKKMPERLNFFGFLQQQQQQQH